MIEIVELEASHFADLVLQDAQSMNQPMLMDDRYAESLIGGGPHFAALLDGIVIGSAGVFMVESHRGWAWALIARGIGADLYHMHKAVKRFLDESDIQRIETTVYYDFDEGHRWAKMLGFKAEGVMQKYYPGGEDAVLYARVQ